MTVLDAYCPTCGARPGEGCRSTFGRRLPVAPHKPRGATRRAPGKPIPQTVSEAVTRRSRGLCEASTPACPDGPHKGSHRHHKLPRSLGGEHTPENLLHVCTTAHTWIHEHPADSYEHGWLTHSWEPTNPLP